MSLSAQNCNIFFQNNKKPFYGKYYFTGIYGIAEADFRKGREDRIAYEKILSCYIIISFSNDFT